MAVTITATDLKDVRIIEPQVFHDARGWFVESYNADVWRELGIDFAFIQDNHSYSASRGIVRGLHFQNDPMAQNKLVRCTRGRLLDVAVDLRRGSPDYRRWVAVELSAENHRMLLVPRGFGHGFVTLTDDVEIQYKVDAPYSRQHDRSVRFDDPAIGVQWGVQDPVLSDKDRLAPLLADSDCNFVYDKGIRT